MPCVLYRVVMFPPGIGVLPSSNSTGVQRSLSALLPWWDHPKMAPCRRYAFCQSQPRTFAFIPCCLCIYRPPSRHAVTRALLYCEITNCVYLPASPSYAYSFTPSPPAPRSSPDQSNVLVIFGVFDGLVLFTGTGDQELLHF